MDGDGDATLTDLEWVDPEELEGRAPPVLVAALRRALAEAREGTVRYGEFDNAM